MPPHAEATHQRGRIHSDIWPHDHCHLVGVQLAWWWLVYALCVGLYDGTLCLQGLQLWTVRWVYSTISLCGMISRVSQACLVQAKHCVLKVVSEWYIRGANTPPMHCVRLLLAEIYTTQVQAAKPTTSLHHWPCAAHEVNPGGPGRDPWFSPWNWTKLW